MITKKDTHLKIADGLPELRKEEIEGSIKTTNLVFKEFFWVDDHKVWLVNIGNNNKTHHIGHYKSLRQAAKARQTAENKMWGFSNISDEQIQGTIEWNPDKEDNPN